MLTTLLAGDEQFAHKIDRARQPIAPEDGRKFQAPGIGEVKGFADVLFPGIIVFPDTGMSGVQAIEQQPGFFTVAVETVNVNCARIAVPALGAHDITSINVGLQGLDQRGDPLFPVKYNPLSAAFNPIVMLDFLWFIREKPGPYFLFVDYYTVL